MVVAFACKKGLDVIMLDKHNKFIIQKRNILVPIEEHIISKENNSKAYDKAEERFSLMSNSL